MNPKISFLLNKSLESLSNSNLESAEIYLKQALRLQSNNSHVLRLLGVISAQRKRYSDSLNYLNDSLKASPKNSATLSNLGNVFFELKDYQSALENYDKSIKVDFKNYEAWYNKGNTLHKLKRYAEAVAHYDQALILKPEYEKCWSNKGLSLHELKRYEDAIAHFDKALNVRPDFAEGWSNKGLSLHQLKRYEEAIDHFNQALNLKPDYAEGWSNKGVTLNELKRYEEAIDHFNQALNLKPDYPEGWSNQGLSLHELKYYDEAIARFNKALSLKPDYAEGWSNKGVTLNELKQYDEAIGHYDRALSLKPDYAKAWANKAITLNDLKRYDEAIAHYNKAISLEPEIDWALGDLIHLKAKICDWLDLPESLEDLSKKIIAKERVSAPFPLLSMCDDAMLHQKSAEIYIQSKYSLNLDLGSISKYSKKEKIRIAYFSPDFRNHAVSLLTSELFKIHDKDKFEIFAFSLQKCPDTDLIYQRLRQSFDKFIDVDSLSDNQVAQLARENEIDIAIDLAGHTQYSRTGIFAHRAAPIQVNWLGYPGTIGADYIDYIVADQTIIPDSHYKFYTEKVVHLPNTFMVDDSKRIASSRIFTRAECGLPEQGFVFCCFNNSYKYNPQVLDGWSRILSAAKNSVLWISENNERFSTNIKIEFEKRGIVSSRIIFAPKLDLMEDYLARYALADLFLDTYSYNAHTTAVDSLKSGVPVLTRTGQSFASRVAASLLNAIRLPELITNTQREYEALAAELAMNPEKLTDIKLKLDNNRLTTPLFDTTLFAKHLETAYIKMYEQYQAGLEPDHISIA
jgi:predicted O-linked N-acetylglucosamine transferase (SPINDLY family)